MTFAPVGALPLATLSASSAALVSLATLGPLTAYGEQAEQVHRHVRFWAHETPRVYWAKESDTQMLGTVDIDPYERVWREIDWRDLLSGATITDVTYIADPGLAVLASSIDGSVTRFLVAGALVGSPDLFVGITASDGSKRGRRLRYRSKEL